MDPERLDLSELGLAADRWRMQRLIVRIRELARPELERRAARAGVLGMLGWWARPMLSAAAVLTVISGMALAATHRQLSNPVAGPAGVVEALNVAAPVASWINEERQPQRSDLVQALEGGVR